MIAISVASILLVSSLGHGDRAKAPTEPICIGTVGGSPDHPLKAFNGKRETEEDEILPAHYGVDIVLPQPFAANMLCSVTELKRRGSEYFRVIICGAKGTQFLTTVATEARPDGSLTAQMGLSGPDVAGKPSIALVQVNCRSK